MDIANRIYLAAQVRAIESGTEEITEGLLRSAYRDDFRLVSHIIETLKSGGPSLLNNVRDVCPPTILPIKDTTANSVVGITTARNIEGTTRAPDAETDQAVSQFSQNNGAAAVRGEESNNTQRDQLFPSNNLPDLTTSKRKRGSRKSSHIDINFEEKDLRGIIALGLSSKPPVDPYRALLAAGHIKDSAEFLPKDC